MVDFKDRLACALDELLSGLVFFDRFYVLCCFADGLWRDTVGLGHRFGGKHSDSRLSLGIFGPNGFSSAGATIFGGQL